jgi:HlyD family secretion protein
MVATGEAKVAAALAGRLRVAIQYEATLAQAEADVTAAQAKTAAEMAAAQRIEEQVALCQIRAPRDGLVVYPPAAPERGPPQLEPLAEGSTVRERQRLLLVCNPEKFLLELRVPEARIAEVRPGQAAAVRLEAVRQKTFTGKVARVSPIPLSSSWRGPDEKFYSVTVDLESGSPELKFGMSAAAQILVAEVSDVLTVPIEAIHRPNGTAVCQVKVGNQREVRQLVLGLSDGRQVEVRQGLKEGDEVFLFPRAPAAPSGEGAAPSR